MTEFQKLVFECVAKIPKGQVSTYGDIAKAIGHPNASRAAGSALHANTDSIAVPCHRVVNSKGRLAPFYAFGGVDAQADKLREEGVEIKCDYVSNFTYKKKEW